MGEQRYIIMKVHLPTSWLSLDEWVEAVTTMKAEVMKEKSEHPRHITVIGGGMACKRPN